MEWSYSQYYKIETRNDMKTTRTPTDGNAFSPLSIMGDAGVALFFHNTDANNDKMKLTLCALKESSLGQSSIIIPETGCQFLL